MSDQLTQPAITDSDYRPLYKLGGIAALIVVLLTVSEVILLAIYPQPASVADWFLLFHSNRILGLLEFWGLENPMYILFAIVFLALYALLRRVNPSWMAIATAFAFLGIGIFFATNNPFSLISLSDQYAAAVSDAQRASFLAAGQAMIANTGQRGVGGFNMGLFLVSFAGVIISAVMLQGKTFNRSTATLGLIAFGLSLADYIRQALTTSTVIALLVILPGALLLAIWFIMVGRRLYQIGRLDKQVVQGL
jgi:hypothetical protein